MKRKIINIAIISIVILISIYKIYQLYVINNIERSIDEFLNYNNWKYSAKIESSADKIVNEYYLDGILVNEDEEYQEYGYINLNKNEKYVVNKAHKKYTVIKNIISIDKTLINSPNIIEKIESNKKINALFSIYFIIPIKFENKLSLKIYTKNEIVIIDAENYLPISMTRKLEKTYENSMIEFITKYKFQTNCVTEEDVQLPDLSQYEEIAAQ